MAIKHFELWKRFKRKNDRDARTELIHEYVALVHYVVSRTSVHLPVTMDNDDLVAAGTLGLIGAVQNFDIERGIEFSTFAVPRIRGAVLDEVRKNHWSSRTVRRRSAQVNELIQECAVQNREPDLAALAKRMNVPRDRVGKVLASIRPVSFVSLTGHGGDDNDGMHVSQLLSDESCVDPQERVQLTEELGALTAALATLPEGERRLISEYYFEQQEQKDIATRLRVSRSRVSQIHSRALATLKKRMVAAGAA
jgi:RNA polymerase sigma factor FliA